MKKEIRRRTSIFLCLLIVAMLFAAAGPVNASADGKTVPFKGNFDGATVSSENPALERIEMSGKASHLGKYTAVIEADLSMIQIIGVDPGTGLPIATLPFAATFTAANGDFVDLPAMGADPLKKDIFVEVVGS